jgi:lipid-binding SYLF domain-containing protein
MNILARYAVTTVSVVAGAFLAAGPSARAATNNSMSSSSTQSNNTARTAEDRVADSVKVVDQMKQDPQIAKVLARAKGVFVIPHYGKGALVVGGQGGGGVVLARREGEWTDPAFFSIGGGSIRAQAGGEGGSIVFLLMTDKAVNKFSNSNNTWALNGQRGSDRGDLVR